MSAATTAARPAQFRCHWGAGYKVTHDEVHGLDFFTNARQYDDKDRRKIARLKVGETWTAPDEYGEHTVTRQQ